MVYVFMPNGVLSGTTEGPTDVVAISSGSDRLAVVTMDDSVSVHMSCDSDNASASYRYF